MAQHKKCPNCGGRDYRAIDRQFVSPEIYRSRAFRLKWHCLTCGHRVTELIDEAE